LEFFVKKPVRKKIDFFCICLVFLILVFMRKIFIMNKAQRIYIDTGNTTGSNYLQVRLEQDVDTLEVMSLKLDTKDAYQNFNADYGVLVGRVTANGGVGIPNAKVSVFIPLQEEDKYNSDIVSVYPYKNPRIKNNNGKRYNLLPRVSKADPDTGIVSPKQPFGSFPIKEEIVTNETQLKVYKKYYKYTTVSNQAGDYMIFGVPTGTQTIHMSCDITDIGKFSMNPASMVTNLGYSPNLFTDNGSKIKPSNDLDDLPNIETQEITVDIIPFWGDTENFEIGITQQDFRIRAQLVNTFVIFGSVYTDGDGSMTGQDYQGDSIQHVELYRVTKNEGVNIGIASKRIGKVTESIYYYPNTISDDQIANADPTTDMLKLDKSSYSTYKRDGDFIFIINCNRRRVTTNEFGDEVVIPDDSTEGAFTEFKGFVTLQITIDDVPMDFYDWLDSDNNPRGKVTPIRYTLKFPQNASKGNSFREVGTGERFGGSDEMDIFWNDQWRKQHFTFSANTLYSIARFHGLVHYGTTGQFDPGDDGYGFLDGDHINEIQSRNAYNNTSIIVTNDFGYSGNSLYNMPSNAVGSGDNTGGEFFGANWMNFSAHLPQHGYLNDYRSNAENLRSNSNFSYNFRYRDYYFKDNLQEIAAGDFNTKWFARSDLHWTDFIHVPASDVKKIVEDTGTLRGFKLTTAEIAALELEGEYKSGADPCPINGGKVNANPAGSTDYNTYFFRGFGDADCLGYLIDLGIVT